VTKAKQADDRATPPSPDKQINIRIFGPANQEVYFRITVTTPLKKVMELYCNRCGYEMDQILFMFDGDSLREPKMQTPLELQMEDGDSIDAIVKQVGC